MTTTTTAPSVARPYVSTPVTTNRLHAVIATRARPDRPNPLSASFTFGWRAMLKIKHVPEQLFDVTAFPIMFVLMFTYLFGGALAGSPREYIQYLAPGILVQTVVMITMYTGTVLNNDIRKGIFDRFRALPIWRPSFLVGALLGDALRYSIASAVLLSVAMALGFRPAGGVIDVVLAVALLLVFAFSLSWIWTSLAMIMRTQESLMFMSMMILFPLTFISNIFVRPETMPSWLQSFVNVNPISLLATAVRGVMAGEPNGGDIGIVLMVCVVMVAVFGPLTMYLYRNKQ
jgi:ABC-2 type transport system permease protein